MSPAYQNFDLTNSLQRMDIVKLATYKIKELAFNQNFDDPKWYKYFIYQNKGISQLEIDIVDSFNQLNAYVIEVVADDFKSGLITLRQVKNLVIQDKPDFENL
jgi:hypothetical protein